MPNRRSARSAVNSEFAICPERKVRSGRPWLAGSLKVEAVKVGDGGNAAVVEAFCHFHHVAVLDNGNRRCAHSPQVSPWIAGAKNFVSERSIPDHSAVLQPCGQKGARAVGVF